MLANPSNKGEERKGREEKTLFRKNGFTISRHLWRESNLVGSRSFLITQKSSRKVNQPPWDFKAVIHLSNLGHLRDRQVQLEHSFVKICLYLYLYLYVFVFVFVSSYVCDAEKIRALNTLLVEQTMPADSTNALALPLVSE